MLTHRVAIVGVWHVHAADYLAEALARPDTEVAGIWDEEPERLDAFEAGRHLHRYQSLESLLSDDTIDAVIITSSTATHRQLIHAALNAGKHVFVEKVMAPSLAEVRELYRQAGESGKVLHGSFQRLREGWVGETVDLIASGRLGRLTSTRVRYQHPGRVEGWLPEDFVDPARAGGGVLIDLAVHGLYLSQELHGAFPVEVQVAASSMLGGVEDTSIVLMRFPDDSLSVLEASLVSAPGGLFAEAFGTHGTVTAGFDGIRFMRRGDSEWTSRPAPEAGTTPLAEFFRQIDSPHATDDVPARVLRVAALVDAVYAANHTRTAVAVIDPVITEGHR